jgi:transposase
MRRTFLPYPLSPPATRPVFGRPNGPSPAWRSATDMRTVVDAILYIASTARQWRQPPNDFPSHSTYRVVSAPGHVESLARSTTPS